MVCRPVGVFPGMKKLMIPVAAVLAVTLAACGGGNGTSNAPSSSGVLKDTSGMALYTPSGETVDNVRCTGACTAIWKPLRPGDAKFGKTDVITRPDGTKQLALGGKPLYTFVQDSPGATTGDGVSDAFAGKRFTWHAVTAGGGTSSAPATSAPSGGGGYGSSGGY
jgi:predicted lipoprotein with Yx(FWY)xxD motif